LRRLSPLPASQAVEIDHDDDERDDALPERIEVEQVRAVVDRRQDERADQREGAKLGVFLTLNPQTREMDKEAASAGLYDSGGGKVPRRQILTAAEVIEGKRSEVPFDHTGDADVARVGAVCAGDREFAARVAHPVVEHQRR
jgi:hypothetical protein